MAQTVETDAAEARPTAPLGLGLLATSWRLFAAHWWELVAIAACAYAAHGLVMDAAVLAYRGGAVPGLLAFCFVPLVPLIATVLMLLRLRDHRSGTGRRVVLTAIGSVLIPFLVVYEGQGAFRADLSEFLNAGFWDQYTPSFTDGDGEGGAVVDNLTLDAATPLALAVVVVAFLLRVVGARLAQRDALWVGAGRRRLRTVVRVLAGYAEVVWIVIGAAAINQGLGGLQSWWMQRRVGRALGGWWESVSVSLPDLGAAVDWLVAALGTLLDGVVTGLVAPLAWLAIGVVIYGMSAAEGISEDDVRRSVDRRRGLGALSRRLDPAVVSLAWRRVADTEGRFGALLGGAAMILRSRFLPVLVFCAVYTVLDTGVSYAVWAIARTALGGFAYEDWLAAFGPVSAIASILTLALTAPLMATYADALLVRFGAGSQLRLGRGRVPTGS